MECLWRGQIKASFLGLMTNLLEEQETKALQDATHGAGTKDGPSQPGKRKDKRTPLDLPLKQSIKESLKVLFLSCLMLILNVNVL